MVKFRCTKCNFEIEPINKERRAPFNKCPYCGAEGCMVLKKHILDEI